MLAALERQPPTGNYQDRMYSPLLDRSLDRFLRAEMLSALGRDDEAIPLYRSFEWYTQYNRAYAALAHLALGRIAERGGRLDDARRHYERVMFLYTEADPEVRPILDEAGEALQRIG
jgi:tetratricopeptide (TPR) repeat protein